MRQQAWLDAQLAQLENGDLEDLLGAAEQVSSRLSFPNGGEWKNWLRSCFEKLNASNHSALQALAGLGVPLATTNYDDLLGSVSA